MSLCTHRLAASAILGLALSLSVSAQIAPPASERPSVSPAAERLNLGLRGIYFVENHGQWSDDFVHFGLKSRGLDVAFRESSFTMHLSREVSRNELVAHDAGAWASRPCEPAIASDASLKREQGFFGFEDPDPLPHGRESFDESAEYEHLTLTVTFPGGNPVTPRGARPQTAKFNYFVGGEGRGVASNVSSFGAVVYEDLYDGIDLHVMGNDDGVMKYEFHCAPGADYTQIRIHYDGIDSLCVNDDGDLEIATRFGTLRDGAPHVWQEDEAGGTGVSPVRQASGATAVPAVRDGSGVAAILAFDRSAGPVNGRDTRSTDPTIPARFELIDATTYRIALDAAPDPLLPLMIDPEVEWMYYLGGSGWDQGSGITIDNSGNALVTGQTRSADFAGRNNSYYGGDRDAYALKVSPSGQLLWTTYLGGSGTDTGNGIAVDSADNALVTGWTESTDFAGRNNSYYGGDRDAFALKVSPSGQLQWMTYLGGTAWDNGYRIAVDSAGNSLVTGFTASTDFAERTNSSYGNGDAFLLGVSPSGQLLSMTYFGGSGEDVGLGIAVDSSDNAMVAGNTRSTDFAGRNNSYYGGNEFGGDVFVLKVSPSGQLQWMIYLGGSGPEGGFGIAVDSAGNALVTGNTTSTDFAGRSNSYYGGGDAFALKVSPSGQALWMTYLGGSNRDAGYGIVVDSAGNALLSGYTRSTDFAGRNNAHYSTEDAFALKVSPPGQLEWMTYLGGSGGDVGLGIAVDNAGNALVIGDTFSTDFAGRNNSLYGDRDAFIVKLRLADGPSLTVLATCPSGGPIRIEWSGATPGGQIALIYARNTGSFIIPNNRPCAGTVLGLGSNQIQLAWQGGAGANGSRTLNASAGPAACGGHLQLLDLTTCATSNVARIE